MSDQSNYIDQAWELDKGILRLSLTSPDPLPAQLVTDLSSVVAAIEAFVEAWGPQIPDWDREMLGGVGRGGAS